MARDTAESPNLTVSGPFTFNVVEYKGHVLIVDNRAQTKSENKGRGSRIHPGQEKKRAPPT